jgi:hypothetical protein
MVVRCADLWPETQEGEFDTLVLYRVDEGSQLPRQLGLVFFETWTWV